MGRGGSGNVWGMGVQPSNLQMIEAGEAILPQKKWPFCLRKSGHFAPPTIFTKPLELFCTNLARTLPFLTTDLYYKTMQ